MHARKQKLNEQDTGEMVILEAYMLHYHTSTSI